LETKQKIRIGRVLSNKMEKTVVVAIESSRHHPLYKKSIKKVEKCKAHDPKKECAPGDVVKIVETRPLSREKRWRVAAIVTKKEAVTVQPTEVK
jgi:small subunit ribosomal protein S17